MEGTASAPPSTPGPGETWLVGAAPTGAWSGREDCLAAFQGGGWVFVSPRDGLRVLDRSTGQDKRYVAGWQAPARPADPAGGSVVDVEARVILATLLDKLSEAGIFAP